MLPRNDGVFQRKNLDSGEENVEVVDLSVNDANIEGLDVTPNTECVKRINDVRDLPTNDEPFHESSIRSAPLY